MTEDEAKTKWCPFARVAPPGNGGNRYSFDTDTMSGPYARCLGSLCMAWRAGGERIPTGGFIDQSGQNQVTTYSDAPGGYCGLAGRP